MLGQMKIPKAFWEIFQSSTIRPSTGKSLLLRDLFGSHPQYLYLDGRKSGSNLMNAIIESIKMNSRLKDVKMSAWSAIAPTLAVIIMATSDYGFLPFTLSNIGYNRNHHVKQSIVLSDDSPQDTLVLLTNWGVRPKLVYLVVEVYGGHMQISRALNDLCNKHENAEIDFSFINGLEDQLVICIAESKKMYIEKGVISALETLIRTGFYPCEYNNPAADLITKYNIGEFIAEIPGLSRNLQRGRAGLVPST
eukprot:gene13360-17919_t